VLLTITVRQGVFRGRYFVMALGLFCLPFVILGLLDFLFERARWENSNVGATRPSSLLAVGAILVGSAFALVALVYLIKVLGDAS